MINHIWTVLCTNSVIDEGTKNISLIQVVEQLTVIGTPPIEGQVGIVPFNFDVVSLWERFPIDKPEKKRCKMRQLDPSGEVIKEQIYELDLTAHSRFRTITKIGGLPIKRGGRHLFNVSYEETPNKWIDVASIPLMIQFQIKE
ncbi:MAG: hypothetical protein V1799_03780 [bacterium]